MSAPSCCPGVYDFPACHIRITAAFTNTLPVDAYRGAGRPEAAYLIERLVDTAARDLGIAPEALRKRNFIKPKAMPYTTPTSRVYDSGDFAAPYGARPGHHRLEGFLAGAPRNPKRPTGCAASGSRPISRRAAATDRTPRPCGSTATATSRCWSARNRPARATQTAYAQLVAEHLDLPPERVTVVQGDTDLVATGAGTGGSSSITCGGASVDSAARKLADNLKALAAHELEAVRSRPRDRRRAGAHRRHRPRRLVRRGLRHRSGRRADLLAVKDAVGPPQPTYPNGTHIAEVEIDPDTGHIDILAYVIVDDFGVTLNPLLLAGQVHGGAVQGIGQAMMENTVYDADVRPARHRHSLMDYALPRAEDAPSFTFETRNVRCATNPLGVKGAGEAGTIGAAPAVMNAVMDALYRAYRIRHIDMPATPERVWAALREGERMHTL